LIVIVTLLILGGHTPLVIVQLKTYTPGTRPVTVVFGEFGFVIVDPEGPLTYAHIPVPDIGAFPASVTVVAAHNVWAGPATDVVGAGLTMICTVEALEGQTPLLIVHLNT
jgi:hypothetical protein